MGDPAPASIPLPPTPDGSRAKRRRQMQRIRRQQVAVAIVLVVALLATIVLIAVDRRPSRGDNSGIPANSTTGAAVVKVPPVLLAERADDGKAAWLTALVPARNGQGGNLVLIPAGTMAEVPSLGLEPVSAALSAGGADRLLFTSENLVGASLGTVDVVDADHLTELLAPTGALVVDIPERVEDVFASGRVAVLYEPGRNRVEPAEVSRLLTASGRGTELTRLARHQAFWDAWLGRIKQNPELAPGGALGKALRALASGTWQVRVLPVQSAGTLGAGQDIYQVDRKELTTMVRAVFPGARAAAAARPRVQILNGTGELELAQRVSQKLIPAGIEVALTGNANPLGQQQTQVIYYDANKRSMAEKVKEALGVGILVRNRNQTDVVDVTVIVGKDFPTK
ncbi:MAG: hypothetical protein QOE35_2456 [Actinomycetota bacterium]